MGDQDYGIVAGTGCATGILWSAVAGNANLSTGKGWLRALAGCAGSAANSVAIYAIADAASGKRETAWRATSAWWSVQGGAGITNWLGRTFSLADEPAYNAIAVPLNYAATPFLSTAALLYAGGAFALATDPSKHVRAYGGMLTFNHEPLHPLPGYRNAFAVGAIGIGVPRTLRKHESGHVVQSSILGDIGMPLAYGIDWLVSALRGKGYPNTLFEHWADDIHGKESDSHTTPFERPIGCPTNGKKNGTLTAPASQPVIDDASTPQDETPARMRALLHAESKVRRAARASLKQLDDDAALRVLAAIKGSLAKHAKLTCRAAIEQPAEAEEPGAKVRRADVRELRQRLLAALRQIALDHPAAISHTPLLHCSVQDIVGWDCDGETTGLAASTLAAMLPHVSDADAQQIFVAIPRFVKLLAGPYGSYQLSEGLWQMAKASRYAAERIAEALIQVGESGELNSENATRLIHRLVEEKILSPAVGDEGRVRKLAGQASRDGKVGWYAGVGGGWGVGAAERGLSSSIDIWGGYRNFHHLELRGKLSLGSQGVGEGGPSQRVGLALEPIFHLSRHPRVLDPYIVYDVGTQHFLTHGATSLSGAAGAGLMLHAGAFSVYGEARGRANLFLGAKPAGLSSGGGEFRLGAAYHF
jgi:hypothetical protein